jgi:nitrogen fixation/metabolism regulation signal transduction histidine kinase
MRLFPKFFIPVVVATVLLSFTAGLVISNQIKTNAINRAQLVTADYIQSNAVRLLSPSNFNDKDFLRQHDRFRDFMGTIQTKEIIKIKVFNTDFDIIYSTSKENIGQKTESGNYKKARVGEIAAQIKKPVEEAANIDLLGYRQVMEVYVPVFYDNEVQGVIETYYKMDYINEDIRHTTRKVLWLIAIFAVSILVSIFIILRIVVINPITQLKGVADKVSNGELDIQLPDIKSKDEIRDLNEALKGVFAAIEFLTDEVKKKDSESE